MNQEQFINWLEDSSWIRGYSSDNSYWLYERDYNTCTYSYLTVYETYVEYTYEDEYWGGSSIETKNYSFEDFVHADENYELP